MRNSIAIVDQLKTFPAMIHTSNHRKKNKCGKMNM